MDLPTSIRKSSIWLIVRLVISSTIGVFVTTYIIRSLSVRDYGVYSVLYALIGYIGVIGSFGIPAVLQRFVPEAYQQKEFLLLKKLVFRGLLLRLLISTATVCTILLLHGPVGSLLKIEDFVSYFKVFAWGVVLSLEASLMTRVLHSLFLHKYSVIASTLYTVIRGTSVFLLLHLGWGIQGVLWGEVVSWGLWLLLQLFFFYIKFVRLHTTSEETPLPLWRYVRYGGFSSLSEMGSFVLGASTDFLVITVFLGPAAVAMYAFADRVVRLLTHCMPHMFLVDVIRPSFFAKYTESGNQEHLDDMFNFLLKIAGFSVFPLAAGMFAIGDKMILVVFKAEYLEALPILWVLAGLAAVNIFYQPVGLTLKAIEQVQYQFYSKVFSVYNLIGELLVIHKFGVMGVVLVTCSAILMKNAFLFYFVKRHVDLRINWRGMLAIAINASVMAIALVLLRPFANSFASLALAALLGIVVYLLLSWLNTPFTPRERDWLNRVVPRPISVF